MTIAESYEDRPGWYRSGQVAALVLRYYGLLRSIVGARTGIRLRRARCRRCGIFFFAHACNAGRRDLRCPFGCREAHRRLESTRRSVAYYRDESGKMKKRIQNERRGTEGAAPVPAAAEPSEKLIKHLQMVLSSIEGRKVSREEVLALRQRSLAERNAAADSGGTSDARPP